MVLVSEGARLTTHEGVSFESDETDMFGHRKLAGIGDKVSAAFTPPSPRFQGVGGILRHGRILLSR